MQYDDNNRGAAFERQSENPKAPQWSGPVKIEGKDYEISIWQQTSKSGKDFLSLKFGPPWQPKEKGSYTAPKVETPRTTDAPDDDIPF